MKGIASNIAELHRGGFIIPTFTLVGGGVLSIFDEKGFSCENCYASQVSANLYVFFVVQAIHIAIDGAVWLIQRGSIVNLISETAEDRSYIQASFLWIYYIGSELSTLPLPLPPIATFFMWKCTGDHRNKVSRSSKRPFQDIYTRFIRAGISYMMLQWIMGCIWFRLGSWPLNLAITFGHL